MLQTQINGDTGVTQHNLLIEGQKHVTACDE